MDVYECLPKKWTKLIKNDIQFWKNAEDLDSFENNDHTLRKCNTFALIGKLTIKVVIFSHPV